MLWQGFALGSLGKENVDGCRLKAGIAQGLLHGLAVSAMGNVVGGHSSNPFAPRRKTR